MRSNLGQRSRLRRYARAFLVSSALLVCTSCVGPVGVQPEALQGVLGPVLDRHDAYVRADAALDPLDKATYLRSSALIRETVQAAVGTPVR